MVLELNANFEKTIHLNRLSQMNMLPCFVQRLFDPYQNPPIDQRPKHSQPSAYKSKRVKFYIIQLLMMENVLRWHFVSRESAQDCEGCRRQ